MIRDDIIHTISKDNEEKYTKEHCLQINEERVRLLILEKTKIIDSYIDRIENLPSVIEYTPREIEHHRHCILCRTGVIDFLIVNVFTEQSNSSLEHILDLWYSSTNESRHNNIRKKKTKACKILKYIVRICHMSTSYHLFLKFMKLYYPTKCNNSKEFNSLCVKNSKIWRSIEQSQKDIFRKYSKIINLKIKVFRKKIPTFISNRIGQTLTNKKKQHHKYGIKTNIKNNSFLKFASRIWSIRKNEKNPITYANFLKELSVKWKSTH